jgi:hypothetical protein
MDKFEVKMECGRLLVQARCQAIAILDALIYQAAAFVQRCFKTMIEL